VEDEETTFFFLARPDALPITSKDDGGVEWESHFDPLDRIPNNSEVDGIEIEGDRLSMAVPLFPLEDAAVSLIVSGIRLRLGCGGSDEEREGELTSESDDGPASSEDVPIFFLDGTALLEVILLKVDDAVVLALAADKSFLLLAPRTGRDNSNSAFVFTSFLFVSVRLLRWRLAVVVYSFASD